MTAGCTACGTVGECTTCGSGYTLTYESECDADAPSITTGSCAVSSQCYSGSCKGGNCCTEMGMSTGCIGCYLNGTCSACSSGHTLTDYECVVAASPPPSPPPPAVTTGDCSDDSECTSGSCKNGYCCTTKGMTTGCTACYYDGTCFACGSGYTKINYDECVVAPPPPPWSPAVTTGSCSDGKECDSGLCLDSICCTEKGMTAGCIKCGWSYGHCDECSSGYTLSADACYDDDAPRPSGSCTAGSECISGSCKGGYCCTERAGVTGCTDCNTYGDCNTCSFDFTREEYSRAWAGAGWGYECVAVPPVALECSGRYGGYSGQYAAGYTFSIDGGSNNDNVKVRQRCTTFNDCMNAV